MTPRNIRQTDLNLLIALNVLMEERNVTRAADRLDLTQSAASRMLGRLRATFDDPLFVRTSRGLTPTKRALDLAGPLQEYLAGLEKLLLERGDFDAATARRRFRIAAIDYVQAVLLAPLVAKLQHQAPQIDFEIRQPSTESERDLDAGVLDFLLMPQQRSGPGVVWTPLYRDTYTCLVWNRHSVERLTLTRFAAMEHVLVAPRERAGVNAIAALAWNAGSGSGAVISGALRGAVGPAGYTVNLLTLVFFYAVAAALIVVFFRQHVPSGDVGALAMPAPDSRA